MLCIQLSCRKGDAKNKFPKQVTWQQSMVSLFNARCSRGKYPYMTQHHRQKVLPNYFVNVDDFIDFEQNHLASISVVFFFCRCPTLCHCAILSST